MDRRARGIEAVEDSARSFKEKEDDMRNLEDDHTALMGTLEKRAEEIQALGASNVERRAELESTRGRVTTLECQVTEGNARLKTMNRTRSQGGRRRDGSNESNQGDDGNGGLTLIQHSDMQFYILK